MKLMWSNVHLLLGFAFSSSISGKEVLEEN